MSNRLEQLEFKLEKNIGAHKHTGKVRKGVWIPVLAVYCIEWELKNSIYKAKGIRDELDKSSKWSFRTN